MSEQIKISHAMVEAGVRVLRASGFLFAESSGDAPLVKEILCQALKAREQRSKAHQSQSKGSQKR